MIQSTSTSYTPQAMEDYFNSLTISVSVETQELTTMMLDLTANTLGVLSITAAITAAEVIIDACEKDFASMDASERAEWAQAVNKRLEKSALPRLLIAGIFAVLSTVAPWMIALYAAVTGVKVMNKTVTLLIKLLREQAGNKYALQLADALEMLQASMNYVLNSYSHTFRKYIGNARRKAYKVTKEVTTKGLAVIAQLWEDMVTKPLESTQMNIHQVIAQGPPSMSKELMKLIGLTAAIGAVGATALLTAAGIASAGAGGAAAAGGSVVVAEGIVAGAPILLGTGSVAATGSSALLLGTGGTAVATGGTAAVGGSAFLLSNPVGWATMGLGGIGWLGWRHHQKSIVMLPIKFN